jgi:Rod binding domain-containing protein
MKISADKALDLVKRNGVAPLKPLDVSVGGETGFAQQLHAQGAPQSASHLRPLTPTQMIPGVPAETKPLEPLAPPAAKLLPLGTSPFDLGRPRPTKTEQDRVEEQARKWLAQTFYGPMLKQMRESPFKSEVFSGGRGGQAFSSMLDQRLADHMSRATSSKLVKSITRRLMANKAGAKAPSAGARPPVAAAAPAASPLTPPPAAGNPFENVRIHVAPNLRA